MFGNVSSFAALAIYRFEPVLTDCSALIPVFLSSLHRTVAGIALRNGAETNNLIQDNLVLVPTRLHQR